MYSILHRFQIRWTFSAALAMAVVLVAGWFRPARAEEIDCLIVAVNGRVLTQLDLELSRHMNQLLSAEKGGAAETTRDEISRMIDLELIRQELQNFPIITEDEGGTASRMEDLRKSYGIVAGGLQAAAREYGLTESDIQSYLRLQDSIMRFISFRFGPFITVTDAEVERYYREKLVPRLQEAKAAVPPLEEVAGKIKEIMREDKVNAAVEQWIQDLRRHSRIEYFLERDVPPFVK